MKRQGWSEQAIHTALSALIVRTVYATSEHASYFTMRDNSAAAELYSSRPDWLPGRNALYTITDHLFNIDNKLMLFDLTNFYFEGSKREIKLREVHTAPDEDYLLEITSPSKAMTEASMNRQWRSRFEAELIKMGEI